MQEVTTPALKNPGRASGRPSGDVCCCAFLESDCRLNEKSSYNCGKQVRHTKDPLARGMSEPGNTSTNTNAGQNRGGRNSYPRGRGQGPVQRGNEGTTAGRRYDGARA